MSPVQTQVEALLGSLDGFIALLQRESECLVKKNPEALAQVLDEKNRVTATMGEQWTTLCRLLGLSYAERSALEARITERGDQTTLDTWRKVGQLSQQARDLNEKNGTMIRVQLLQTNKAIEILQTASRQNGTYGPDGLSDGRIAFSRTIDKA